MGIGSIFRRFKAGENAENAENAENVTYDGIIHYPEVEKEFIIFI